MKNYQKFAAVYDSIMDDSLYDKWTDFSLRHFPKNKKKLLELACGTGIQSIRFKQAGFDVTGLDLSADMLDLAKKRAQSAHLDIPFIQGNMLDLSSVGKFDLVTCYSDSLCYMEDEVAVGDVFEQVYAHLIAEGLLSLMCIRPIRPMRFFRVTLTMKIRKTLPWFGILIEMRHHILLSMN